MQRRLQHQRPHQGLTEISFLTDFTPPTFHAIISALLYSLPLLAPTVPWPRVTAHPATVRRATAAVAVASDLRVFINGKLHPGFAAGVDDQRGARR